MYNTESGNKVESEYDKIGGVLILTVIGLVTSVIRVGIQIAEFFEIFSSGAWDVLTTPGSSAYHSLWAPTIVFESVINVIMLVYLIILVVLLFKRKRIFPKAIITFYIFSFIVVAIDVYLINSIPYVAEEINGQNISPIIQRGIACVIWIPYFTKSKRVKGTFTN